MDNETRENISNFLREYKRAMQEFQDSPEAEAIVQTLKAIDDFNTNLAISIEKSGLLEIMRDFSASLEKVRPALEYLSQYEPALYEQVDDVLAQVEPLQEYQWEYDALPCVELEHLSFIVGGLEFLIPNMQPEYQASFILLHNILFCIAITKIFAKCKKK